MSFVIGRHALAAILVMGLQVAPCFASDQLGTAGPIRSFGGKICNMDFAATMRGECDPPPVASTLPLDRRSQERVERARQLISVPRVEQAIYELDGAIADDPSNIPALLLRGRLRIPDKLDDALKDTNRILQIVSENSDALATRAFILIGQDEQGSLRDATKALAVNPKNVDALWIRAFILVQSGRLEEAERDLNFAVELEPDDPRTLLARARIRMHIGKIDEARSDATAVLAVRYYDVDALQIRAVVQAMSGHYADALDDLNAILGKPEDRPVAPIRPDFVDMYVQRALALTRIGKPAEAKRDLATIVTLGGARAVLQMQLYLRDHGFPDVKLDGKRSDQLDDALEACFINDACGRGIAIRG